MKENEKKRNKNYRYIHNLNKLKRRTRDEYIWTLNNRRNEEIINIKETKTNSDLEENGIKNKRKEEYIIKKTHVKINYLKNMWKSSYVLKWFLSIYLIFLYLIYLIQILDALYHNLFFYPVIRTQ